MLMDKYMSKKSRPHKAHFLISNFLMSSDALAYELNGNAQSILRYMGDIMDATYNKGGQRTCAVNNSKIAQYAGCSVRTVQTVIARLLKLEILQLLDKKESNIGRYIIGETLLVRQPLPKCSSATSTSSSATSTSSSATIAEYNNTDLNTDPNTDVVIAEEKILTAQEKSEQEANAKAARELIRNVCRLKTIGSEL